MTVVFFGHRDAKLSYVEAGRLWNLLKNIILLYPETRFLNGHIGNFDALTFRFLTKLRDVSPFRIEYVIDGNLERVMFLLDQPCKLCHDGYAKAEVGSTDNFIRDRNRWMVREADILIFYVKKKRGGAAEALRYAQKQGKLIYNIGANPIEIIISEAPPNPEEKGFPFESTWDERA